MTAPHRTVVGPLLPLILSALFTSSAPAGTSWTQVIENRKFTSGLGLTDSVSFSISVCAES